VAAVAEVMLQLIHLEVLLVLLVETVVAALHDM
jgi:hypothetical protein